jgi:hypothetical protein
MPRPLTPLSEERIKEYEKKLEDAFTYNDKEGLKRWKRLFRVYIGNRGLNIKAFKDNSIYKYFLEIEKPKKVDILKQEIKTLKEKLRDDSEEFKKYVLNAIEVYRTDKPSIIEIVNAYFSNDLDKYSDDAKEKLKIFMDRYRKRYDESVEKIDMKIGAENAIKQKRKEITRLIDKKYKMREYRKRVKTEKK